MKSKQFPKYLYDLQPSGICYRIVDNLNETKDKTIKCKSCNWSYNSICYPVIKANLPLPTKSSLFTYKMEKK